MRHHCPPWSDEIFYWSYSCKNTVILKQHLHAPLLFRFMNLYCLSVCFYKLRKNPQDTTLKVRLQLCVSAALITKAFYRNHNGLFSLYQNKIVILEGPRGTCSPTWEITNSKSLSYIFFFFLKTGGKIWTYMVLESLSTVYFL